MPWANSWPRPAYGTGFVTFEAKQKRMKKRIGLWLLLLAAPLMAFAPAHKFYVSVTNVDYSEKAQSLQIISRIFTDDMEEVLLARYDFEASLGTETESAQADAYLERYFRTKFSVTVNGVEQQYQFLGKRYDKDLLMCYIEVPGVAAASLKSVEVANTLLTDLFDEQRNLVHFSILGQKKSFVLTSAATKGMLNL